MTPIPPEVEAYLEIVEGGGVRACREQHLLAALVRRVFAEEDLVVDAGRIAAYMGYQRYFPFELFPWEKFVFVLHNCVFRADGRPRWRDLLIYCGRGSGKNGYLSFAAFCYLTPAHGIPHYNVDICATTERQAKTSFSEVYDVLENPKFARKFAHNFHWNQDEIRGAATKSALCYHTNNFKSKDGLRSGAVIFDEVHAYENWKNIEVFTGGLGKVPHSRILYATTDGEVRGGVLDELKALSESILTGAEADGGFLPFICRLDADDEVHDERNWVKAIPSLPYFPDLLDEIRSEYRKYKISPHANRAFMTKRMNRPQAASDCEVTSWENILRTNRPNPDLARRSCVIGVDFTKTSDFMAAFALFKDGGGYCGFHHSWFCTASRDGVRIKLPLDEMAARGLLTIVDDVEINPELVCAWIDAQMRRYTVEKVAIDSYRYALLARALTALGFDAKRDVKLVRPSDIMLVQPLIDSLFQTGKIGWGDDPMMRWYTNNAKLEPAPNNNYKYGKIEPNSRKTDGFMAFVASMTAADAIPEPVGRMPALKPILF